MPNSISEAVRRFLIRRKTAYGFAFPRGGRHTNVVLADLARFCRADRSTFHPDSHIAARLDGRREVWLRISQHLNMTPDELAEIYGAKKDAGD